MNKNVENKIQNFIKRLIEENVDLMNRLGEEGVESTEVMAEEMVSGLGIEGELDDLTAEEQIEFDKFVRESVL